jgi:asparagine N-glycosylation enzyme membrane subunit Stt3
MKRGGDIAAALLLTLAVAIVVWIRLLPLSLPAVAELAASTVRGRIGARVGAGSPADWQRAVEDWISAHADEYAAEVAAETDRLRTMWQYTDEGGRPRTFLGDYDSYAWLRAARNYLSDGSVCDAPDGGACRDRFTLAPVGTAMRYGRSLHVAAIVAVHRFTTWLDPVYPLAASSYLVPVIVGALGVVPAFAIGRRLAGPVGGFVAGVAGGLHPMLLQRSLGSDNDVWNTALPCAMVWAVIAALQARRRPARIACAALAGVLAGLHAATWRGWSFTVVVVVVGVGIVLLLHVLRAVLRGYPPRFWRAASVRSSAVVLLIYCAATALCTYVAGAEQWTQLRSGGETAESVATTLRSDTLEWPSALAQVSELYVPTLGGIAAQSYGDVAFFAGWIGLLLLLLPRRDWRVPHFAVLVGATLLYRYLLTADLGRALVVALLLLPLTAAAAVAVSVGDDADCADIDAGVIVATWLLAALFLSYQAMRFVLLLAPPLGIACGVAAGRLHLVLDRQARARWPRHATPVRIFAAAAVLATAILPISIGYATARAYLPALDRAFADTFEELRTTTPPDAIVNTWWDYGYWAKYLAERRVSADGGALTTHVPYWLARAELATSEAEALGLLRMLNCGSDALPLPEGAQGAYGKLLQHGLDARAAYAAVVQLASLDRAAADRHLTALGLDAAARSDVLAATHCQPPPSYLVLSTQQAAFDGWWQLARWDPGGDGGPSGQGRELVTADWVPCTAAGGERRCEIRRADATGRLVDAVVYSEGDVPGARLVITPVGGGSNEAPPDVVLVVGRDGPIARADGSAAAPEATAVLLDPDRQRVLLGSPAALTALYTRLAFLDGAGTDHFHKVSDLTGPWGQRVTAWKIEW